MKNKIVKYLLIAIIILIVTIPITRFITFAGIGLLFSIKTYNEEFINKDTEEIITTYIINYLDDKYGNNNYEISKIEKTFSYSGFNRYHKGYNATVISSVLDDNFTIHLIGTDLSKIKQINESFVEKYYKENVNEYLLQKYNLKFDISIKEEKILNNLGHIPTLDDLIAFNAIDNINIDLYNYTDDNNINSRINYLKDLLKDLINYYNISKDITFHLHIVSNYPSHFYYNVQITKNIIKITSTNGEELYEFNINDIKDII